MKKNDLWLHVFTVSIFLLCLISIVLPSPSPAGTPERLPQNTMIERQSRLIRVAIDEMTHSASLARKDIEELGKRIDAMTPLEPPKRENDLYQLRNWYNKYADWNEEMGEEFKETLELPAVYSRHSDHMVRLYTRLSKNNEAFQRELESMVQKYDGELGRLYRLLERRRLLNDSFQSLQEQLNEIEEKLRKRSPADSDQGRKNAERIRSRMHVIQNELTSLYDIKEELLKHYVVIIETGREDLFMLELKGSEYESLGQAEAMMDSKKSSQLKGVYGTLIRHYEMQIGRIKRKLEELDRKRSRVSLVGSLRDLDRSRELADFFLERQQRYSEYINRIRVKIAAIDAELSKPMATREKRYFSFSEVIVSNT